jgi:hypothetical protein
MQNSGNISITARISFYSFIILFFLACACGAKEKYVTLINDCGLYKAYGTVKKLGPDKLALIVNEGSKSEYTLNVSGEDALLAHAYIDKFVESEGKISIDKGSYVGSMTGVKLKVASADPLNENRASALLFIKKLNCK